MYENGEKYLYREAGTAMIVTLLNQEFDGTEMWYDFDLIVEKVLSRGYIKPRVIPEIGSTMTVGYADGSRHYAGWSMEELPQAFVTTE